MDLQTLQTIYYSMAIVFMTLVFLGILTIIISVLYILAKVGKLQRQVQSVITDFKEHPREKAAEVALNVGAGIAQAGAKKVKEIINSQEM